MEEILLHGKTWIRRNLIIMNTKENYPRLDLSQIEQWELRNNIMIPFSYKEYLLEHNAGYFISEPIVFDVPKMGRFALANFLGLLMTFMGLYMH
jgi:hypothetical protein